MVTFALETLMVVKCPVGICPTIISSSRPGYFYKDTVSLKLFVIFPTFYLFFVCFFRLQGTRRFMFVFL